MLHINFYQLLNFVNLILTSYVRCFEQFIYICFYVWMCLCVWIHLSICLPVHLFISLLVLFLCLSAYFPACMHACLQTSIFLSVSLFVRLFGCLHICISAYLPTSCLPICQCVCWGESAGIFRIFLQNWLICRCF